MTYFEALTATTPGLVSVLTQKGISPRYLSFGGAGEVPAKKPTVPTDARSEFLANRAMGDWAEDALAAAIRVRCQQWTVSHYGNAERIAAGEPGFKEFYLAGLEDVRAHGKRPDLLISKVADSIPDDLTSLSTEEVDSFVRKAAAAIEVRSSKFEAIKYMQVRKQDKAKGMSISRETPSFTVKVEDLKIVYRWIERYQVSQSYCQVFFDVVFAINFLDIFRIIANGDGFQIDKPAKSQEKATIMIPITAGRQVGQFSAIPTFEAKERITRLGRHDAYVVPKGGDLTIDPEVLWDVLLPNFESLPASRPSGPGDRADPSQRQLF